MNSVIGIGGIFDPATSAGLDRNHNDFGLTLGHWGAHPGPFFELPILGPSDVRDGLGKVPDYFLRATYWIPSDYDWVSYGLWLPAAHRCPRLAPAAAADHRSGVRPVCGDP